MSERKPDSAGAAAALATIIQVLEPLSAEERQRTMNAASVFYGTPKLPPSHEPKPGDGKDQPDRQDKSEVDRAQHVKQWMQKNNVSSDELDRVFHFDDDGSFDIHDVPGKYKKDQTLNTYILTGVGKYLATAAGERNFDDATVRQFCEKIGCYDQANHAQTLKNHKGGEFSGDKSKGFSLTNVGLKNGAALVKELSAGRSQ